MVLLEPFFEIGTKNHWTLLLKNENSLSHAGNYVASCMWPRASTFTKCFALIEAINHLIFVANLFHITPSHWEAFGIQNLLHKGYGSTRLPLVSPSPLLHHIWRTFDYFLSPSVCLFAPFHLLKEIFFPSPWVLRWGRPYHL